MIFSIPSTQYLADNLRLIKGSCTFKQFSDGEWHVTIHDDVHNKNVWVLAQTGPPADTIIQLLLLCDALKQAGARLNLMITYFGYARQNRPFKGEALSAQLMGNVIELLGPERIEVIHLHNPHISESITNHIPFEFFYGCVENVDVIVAPDKGAQYLAHHIANHMQKQMVSFEKHRPVPEQVHLTLHGDVQNQQVLIVDDMISTGRTTIQAAELLYNNGARSVRVAATHGIFAGDAHERLANSNIEHIYVSNTLAQERSPKVSVIDIAPTIEAIIHR